MHISDNGKSLGLCDTLSSASSGKAGPSEFYMFLQDVGLGSFAVQLKKQGFDTVPELGQAMSELKRADC